jgi:hypothetical protein
MSYDLKEKRGYWKMQEEEFDRFCRELALEGAIRQTTERKKE